MEARKMTMREFEAEFCQDILSHKTVKGEDYYDCEIPDPDDENGGYVKCLRASDGTNIIIDFMLNSTLEDFKARYPSDAALFQRESYFGLFNVAEGEDAAFMISRAIQADADKREADIKKATEIKEALDADSASTAKNTDINRSIYSDGF